MLYDIYAIFKLSKYKQCGSAFLQCFQPLRRITDLKTGDPVNISFLPIPSRTVDFMDVSLCSHTFVV